MFYLVLMILGQGSAISVIPQQYPTEDACKEAGSKWNWGYRCIPAPVIQPNVGNTAIDGKGGYYCGQYPDKCEIGKDIKDYIQDNMPKCRKNHYTNKLECY